ncbi:MAG: pyridoxal-phosphate dependent enzyme, partial [Pseudomonadota bacterium]
MSGSRPIFRAGPVNRRRKGVGCKLSVAGLDRERMDAARQRIRGQVDPSPLIHCPSLSGLVGRPLHLKLELLQPSGSFKVRGVFSKLLSMSPAERAAGVVAVSGGNHGLAVASAARKLATPAQIFMPDTAPARSVERIRADNADLVLCEDVAQAFAAAESASAEGRTYVHPFDDLDVVAGQATIGLELLD